MSDEPRLNADDIQGNVIPGFRRRSQVLVYYGAGSENILRAALSVLAPRLTAVPPVLRHRDARKVALERGDPEPELAELWVNIALGAASLDRLGEQMVRTLDPGFRVGMRPVRTGDPWKPTDEGGGPNPWHPQNWAVGKPSAPVDLLVILAFDDWSSTDGDALLHELKDIGVIELHRDEGRRLPGDAEHFGFADGISEIGVRGEFEVDGVVRPVTTRHGVPPRNGVEYGRPGQPLAWPGQFLVGVETGTTTVDPAPARYRNSSFLVFRRLNQDVRAFEEDTAEVAAALGLPQDKLRALIVGRWPSGAALMRHHGAEPSSPDGLLAENYFGFGESSPDLALASGLVTGAEADAAPVRGLTCPAFAHIRKVNPRDLPTDIGDAGDTRGFQMLRRGLPFGPAYDRGDPGNPQNFVERGLLFLAYQRAPSLQFEKLNTSWMNSDDGPSPGGFDLLVGQRVSPQTGAYLEKPATLYDEPEPAPGQVIAGRRTWVRPSGGAYLFAPSILLASELAIGSHPTVNLQNFSLERHDLKLSPGIFKADGADSAPDLSGPPRYDGTASYRLKAGREELVRAEWPETAFPLSAAEGLRGSELVKLDLSGQHFPTETLKVVDAAKLARSTELRSLKLDGTALSGDALAHLVETLPRLYSLNCAGLDLDDADVATLADVAGELEEIALGAAPPRDGHRFTSSRLTPAVLQALDRLPKLRALSLRGVPLGDDDVRATSLWSRIAKLDLSETGVSDAGILHIASLAPLKQLDLGSTLVGDVGAAALLDKSFTGLDLSHTRVSQVALERADPTKVERLALAGLRLDDGISEWLGRAENLQRIDLSLNPVASRVAAALGSLRWLRSVVMTSTALKAGDVTKMLAAPLDELDVSNVVLGSGDRHAIARSRRLSRVTCSVGSDWTGLEGMGAEAFISGYEPQTGGLPETLRRLRLLGTASTGLVDRLSRLPHLESLSLQSAEAGMRFSPGFARLQNFFGMEIGLESEAAAELASLPSIAALYISGNPFGDDFARTLSPYLHTLELRDTLVGDGAMKAIAALPRLHCIDVPGSKVTAGGVVTLARHAANLQSLALDGRQVDASSVAALGEASRLTEIYLYGEEVTTSTVAALSAVRLRELQLVGTLVRDDAVPHIAAIRGLRVLTLGDELSKEGLVALRSLRPFLDVRASGVSATGSRAG